MRRVHVVLLTLLSFAATASAQTTESPDGKKLFVAFSGIGTLGTRVSPDEVVARLMSFDRNSDGRVAREELLERMQDLVARGDSDSDGALDATEIRRLAITPPAADQVRGLQIGHYSFGGEVGFSSRSHIEGALDDLRLADSTRDQALALVTGFLDTLESPASATLLKEMESLLTPEQLADFKVALTSRDLGRDLRVFSSAGSTPRLIAVASDLAAHIGRYGLPPVQNQQAHAALGRFTGGSRIGHAERSALLDQLKDILSDEERDNFRAALERRPVVKAGSAFGFPLDVVLRGDVVLSGVVDRRSEKAPRTKLFATRHAD